MGFAVTKYGHIAWRVIAVVAFAGTAALAVTLSRVPVRPDHASHSDQVRPAFVPIHLPACSKKGPEFLSVQAIQPRPGIPGLPAP